MRAQAYTAKRFAASARRVVGLKAPLWTCPPYAAETIAVHDLGACDFLYLDLHQPARGADFLAGDDGAVALTADQLTGVSWKGAVVFSTACYLAEGGPMLEALKATGATVIAAPGENYGQRFGAPLLARWVLGMMRLGFSASQALWWGKWRLKFRDDRASVDAQGFEIV